MNTEPILARLQIDSLNQMQNETVHASAKGLDVLLFSPTGTGKTIAFLLSIVPRLRPGLDLVQALILVPSRELAIQVDDVFRKMGTAFKSSCCYGGHSMRTEMNNFREPPAVLVGTPGRIADHLRNESFDESAISFLVLDEFDKSLEFGFQKDLEFIISSLLSLEQRILCSATRMEVIPEFVGLGRSVEIDLLDFPLSKPDLKVEKVLTQGREKPDALFQLLCELGNSSTLVFCNHRHTVEELSDYLTGRDMPHSMFHGGLEQEDRERILFKFRNGTTEVLITTDLAARGLDIEAIQNIVHYELPSTQEVFTHRNGRTARMNGKGTVYCIQENDVFPSFLPSDIEVKELSDNFEQPGESQWQTLYIAAGKKDKISKTDVVGLLIKKGGLEKSEVGMIEIKDQRTYVALKRARVETALAALAGERIKKRKVKIEIAR